MRILYVVPLVAGFRDILEGKADSRGLPSFINPLKKLLNDGNAVDIILVSDYKGSYNIKVDWIKEENIVADINNDFANTKGLHRIINKIRSGVELYHTINTRLKNAKYDFVYCHGTAALLGNILANKYHIRCGYRLYGVVNLASYLKKNGIARTFLKYPVYGLIFNIKKEFMLITDDGTEGNYVFEQLCLKHNYKLHFWLNGVDFIDMSFENYECYRKKYNLTDTYIFHAGRIERIKRQDRIVRILYELHKDGKKVHLFFAGHTSDEGYLREIKGIAERVGLMDFIHFIGAVPREEMECIAHNAKALVLMGDYSNQGNIFFECAMAGAVIITFPEPSLKRFLKDKENVLFVSDEKEAASAIEMILDNKVDVMKLRDLIRTAMRDNMLSWDERVLSEINLIYSGVSTG